MTPDVALILCRFLFDSAALFLWGTSAFLGWIAPADLAAQVSRRLRIWYAFATIVIGGTTVLLLPLHAATIGEGWTDALAPQMLRSIMSETKVGQAWLGQAGAAVLLVASWVAAVRFRHDARAISAGFALISLTISGHAAMNSGWLRTMHRVNDGVHLLSGGAWLGALVPVILILPRLHDARWQLDARTALMRFSTAGHVAVTLVITTGIINTALIVGSPPLNWHRDYQVLLSIKVLIVIVLVALAISNRYILVPRLTRHPSLRPLQWATAAETVLGIGVIGLVALFGTMPPT